MKVLFFIRSMVVGGSQRQLAMLAASLERRGHDVRVAVFYSGGEIALAQRNPRLELLPLGKSGRWDAIGPLVRLRRLLVTERPDVLYAFQPMQAALAALLLPARQRTRLVFAVRAAGMQPHDRLSALSYRLEAWLSRRADLIIANSRAGRADAAARGMPAERIAIVRNGIDTDAMRPDPESGRAQRRAWGIGEDAFVIGCVARLDPMKDHATLLAAAAQFARVHADAHFVLVGGGPADYRRRLAALARAHGLEGRVTWAGEMADVSAAYNGFDIATLSSAFGEGFPNVVGEAMACGIPVVATAVGDVAEMVGEFGAVVEPRSPESLAAGWSEQRRQVSENRVRREAMRAFIVESYGVDRMVRRTEDAFSRLLAGEPAELIALDFT